MSDAELRRQVLDELEFDPSLDAGNIGVAVKAGIVTLTGHVASYLEKYNAEKAVQRVKGVRGIAEEIEVRLPSSATPDDDQLATRAADSIAWDATIPPGAVQVKVQKGWVTLTGSVDWHHQRSACESAIRRLVGVTGIANRIEIKQHVRPGDIKSSVDRALMRNAEIEAQGIRMNVLGGEVTLSGIVHSWHERNAVQRAVWSVPGVTSVVNQLSVS